ncbi:O-antigen ligase family protein [Nitrospira sp. BLG_1]|uniref:O-antigen ligase family protein n=1 Tax=Nitrospira sp. BLG_1 TaxID=3395883 RepID=UPI0039BD3AE5
MEKRVVRQVLDMANLSYGLQTLLAVSPLFVLTIKGWISGILFASSAAAIFIMLSVIAKGDSPTFPKHHNWLWCFVILFTLPVIAIFLGQSWRQDYVGRDYDSPARFLLSMPILLVLFQKRFDVFRSMVCVIPGSILITCIVVTLNPESPWGHLNDPVHFRETTYFVDPLTFGSLNMTLGLCCLLSIDLYGRDDWGVRVYKTTGFIVGVYLSIVSGSRTGWLALPLVLYMWSHLRLTRYRAPVFIGILLLASGSYYLSATLQQRLDVAVQEIISYHWDTLNPQTSVGDRLSFLRMAVFLFSQNPWSGFGDHGFAAFINSPDLNRYALQQTQEFALHSGFHNEIATNMVRSGVWGLLSSSALFVIPALFFIRSLYGGSQQAQKIAVLALGYLACTFISGMTTEVFNLKFTASFHALMFTCFISSLLVHHAVGQGSEKNEST